MLDIINLSHKFTDNYLIKDLTIHFNNKGFYGIIGESGSGKSTLLNIISGIIKPTNGEIYYNNIVLSDLDNQEMSFLRKKEFSYIYQNENLFDNYTLLENVEIILNISNVQFDKEKFNKYLTYLRIADLTYQYVKDLSGGEKQRVALLIALLKDANVILADEVTSNLDPDTSDEIFELLKNISKDKLVIFVSHDHERVNKYCDFVIDITKPTKISNSSVNIIKNNNIYLEPINISSIRNFNKNYRKHNFFDRFIFGFLTFLFIVSILIFNYLGNYNFKGKIENLYNIDYVNESILTNYDFETGFNNFNFIYRNQKENFPDLKKLDFVFEYGYSSSNFNGYSYNSNDYFQNTVFSYFIITDSYNNKSISDNEIVISDYSFYLLANYGIVDTNNNDYTISDRYGSQYRLIIKKTNFLDYYNNKDYFMNNRENYQLTVENEYLKCYINHTTFFNLFPQYYWSIRNLDVQGIYYEINSSLKDNEVIISYDLDDNSNLYHLKFSNLDEIYDVVDIYENGVSFNTVYLNEKNFYRLAVEYLTYNNSELFGFVCYDDLNFNTINKLYKEGYLLVNQNYLLVANLLLYSPDLQIYQITFYVILFCFILFLAIYLLIHKSKNKKENKILSIYGCSQKMLYLANFYYFGILFIISMIAANLVYFSTNVLFQYVLSNILHIDTSFISFFNHFSIILNLIFIIYFCIIYILLNHKEGVSNVTN